MSETAQDEKRKLRIALRLRRAQLFDADPDAGLKLRDVFEKGINLPAAAMVSTYIAQGGEMDPSSLEEELMAKGHRLCLPCVEEREAPLVFRAYVSGDPLRLGVWEIPEPLSSSPVVEPDVLLLPLVGFDRAGGRLGQGGGFYDRTLAMLRSRKKILAIGLAFDGQEIERTPREAHDQPMDRIVTEKGIIDPDASSLL